MVFLRHASPEASDATWGKNDRLHGAFCAVHNPKRGHSRFTSCETAQRTFASSRKSRTVIARYGFVRRICDLRCRTRAAVDIEKRSAFVVTRCESFLSVDSRLSVWLRSRQTNCVLWAAEAVRRYRRVGNRTYPLTKESVPRCANLWTRVPYCSLY